MVSVFRIIIWFDLIFPKTTRTIYLSRKHANTGYILYSKTCYILFRKLFNVNLKTLSSSSYNCIGCQSLCLKNMTSKTTKVYFPGKGKFIGEKDKECFVKLKGNV